MPDLQPLLGQIAAQGVIGILLIISMAANWYFIKKVQQVNDARVQDAQDITNKLLDPITAIKVNSELLISLFTKFLASPAGKQ
jgi:hypothetical protein